MCVIIYFSIPSIIASIWSADMSLNDGWDWMWVAIFCKKKNEIVILSIYPRLTFQIQSANAEATSSNEDIMINIVVLTV